MNEPDPAPEPSERYVLPRNVRVLGLTSLLNDTASEIIFPLLPTFLIGVLGGNKFYLGIIEGAADSIASLLKLWAGGQSDQAGRRKGFILFGYVPAVSTRPLIGLITAPWQLLAIRVSDRIGKGIRSAPRDALIADSTPETSRGRAFGFHRAMDHLGAAIGPAIAAAFLYFWPTGMRTLFLLTIVPGILVVVLLLFGLQEPPQSEKKKPELLQWTLAPFDRNFKLYLLSLVIFTLGNSSDAFLLVRAGELGVPVMLLPVLWGAFHIVKSIGNFTLGWAVDTFGTRRFIIIGWFLYAAMYIAFALATQAWHAWACFMAYALFYGLTEPAEKKLVAGLVPAARKGLAYGWYNFAMGIATLPASLLFGALYQYLGVLAAFGCGAALALMASGLLLGVRSRAMQEKWHDGPRREEPPADPPLRNDESQ